MKPRVAAGLALAALLCIAAAPADPDAAIRANVLGPSLERLYPEQYAKLRNELSVAAQGGAPQEALAEHVDTFFDSFQRARVDDSYRAAPDKAKAYAVAEAEVYGLLSQNSPKACAQLAIDGTLPPDLGETASATLRAATDRWAIAGFEAAKSGEEAGAPPPPMSNAEAGTIIMALMAAGVSLEDVRAMASTEARRAWPPERACQLALRIATVIAAQPAETVQRWRFASNGGR